MALNLRDYDPALMQGADIDVSSLDISNVNTLDVAGTLVVDGASTLTGEVTAPAGVVGDVTGNVTGNLIGSVTPVTAAAEHGTGIIGTAATPTTKRWTEGSVIVTEITVDLTGIASVATANDILCLTAGGLYGFIGRNVVATNGVIFKTQFSCIETPLNGDNDVNCVTNSSGTLTASSAGGTTYIANAGDLLAGQSIQNLVPAMTANNYYYLTAGTGDTAGTYTAGQYVLTTWGHALLV